MLREHAKAIYEGAIFENLPDSAVKNALKELPSYSGRLILVAIGKAGYQMASAAVGELGSKIDSGIVITKYEHVKGELQKIKCYEAGHPVPDQNTLDATQRALELTNDLNENDLVLFLVSGGGSALFESVDCSLKELQDLTGALLASGASIDEVNVIRKRLSNVKGGRFALHCAPAKVFSVILSDVISNNLSVIASGPAYPDCSKDNEAQDILNKYGIKVSEKMLELINRETPKETPNVKSVITGSVSELCKSAQRIASSLGYCAEIIASDFECEARALGKLISEKAIELSKTSTPLAFIYGGETVVHLTGNGKGGRNQEIALSASKYIKDLDNCIIFSVGSDGTDGPTDAAGGICDGKTYERIEKSGKTLDSYLENNDAYTALKLSGDLIFTGPTGTNVNDVAVLLIQPS